MEKYIINNNNLSFYAHLKWNTSCIHQNLTPKYRILIKEKIACSNNFFPDH